MISDTPVQKQVIPPMAIHSSTAAFAPSIAAAPTASPRPVTIPNRADPAIINPQIYAIAILIPPNYYTAPKIEAV